jgi:hypothetical protein
VRKWLASFLPGKFGVTSGFIIPDIIQPAGYHIYEYDIIIYDKDNSPVLWADGHSDMAEQGHRRAIPARHVKAVIEAKATFTKALAAKAMTKLRQLNDLQGHLPPDFTSSVLFFEYFSEKENLTANALESVFPLDPVLGYRGGVILRCDLNSDMVGLLTLVDRSEDLPPARNDDLPMAKDIDTIPVQKFDNGQIVISEKGCAVEMISWNGQWNCVKQYSPWYWRDRKGIELSWSYGNFSKFATEMIGRLEGRDLRSARLFYGQIFDRE